MTPKILLIEDDEGTRFGFSKYLSKAGYLVQEANCLAEAQDALLAQRFDAILLDLYLPDGSGAVPLARLLKDPLTGTLAAEALARVGGTSALRSLAGYWIKFRRDTDTEMLLGLLAHVIEGIIRKNPKIADLEEAILPCLDSPSATVRTYAARCILALGCGPGDEKALSIMAEAVSESAIRVLPACPRNRSDLIVYLLKKEGVEQIWGFQLASVFPEAVTTAVLADAIEGYHNYDYLDCIANALLKIKTPSIAPVLLGLYLKVPVSSRHLLNPLFSIHKKQLRNILIDLDIDDETRLVISAHLGISPVCIALEIFDLPMESRVLVISQIASSKTIMKALRGLNGWKRTLSVMLLSLRKLPYTQISVDLCRPCGKYFPFILSLRLSGQPEN